jgi:hypothetical protein
VRTSKRRAKLPEAASNYDHFNKAKESHSRLDRAIRDSEQALQLRDAIGGATIEANGSKYNSTTGETINYAFR